MMKDNKILIRRFGLLIVSYIIQATNIHLRDVRHRPHAYNPFVFSSAPKHQWFPPKSPTLVLLYTFIVLHCSQYQNYPFRVINIVRQTIQLKLKCVDYNESNTQHSRLIHCKSTTWFSIDSIFGALGYALSSWPGVAIDTVASKFKMHRCSLHHKLQPD